MRLLFLLLERMNKFRESNLGVTDRFRVKGKVNGLFLLLDKSVDVFQEQHAENQRICADRSDHKGVFMRDIGDDVS